jgi:hypothetical protein
VRRASSAVQRGSHVLPREPLVTRWVAAPPRFHFDQFTRDANEVEPRGLLAAVPPSDLAHLDGETAESVQWIARARQAALPERAVLRVLEHATERAHLSDGVEPTCRILARAQELEAPPRPARWMRHHRRRAHVQARIARLIPAAIGAEQGRVRPTRVHVEGNRLHSLHRREKQNQENSCDRHGNAQPSQTRVALFTRRAEVGPRLPPPAAAIVTAVVVLRIAAHPLTTSARPAPQPSHVQSSACFLSVNHRRLMTLKSHAVPRYLRGKEAR